MEASKIRKLADELSLIMPLTEEQKNGLVEHYSSMDEMTVIKELSIRAFAMFSDDEDYYDFALSAIRKINPDLCPPLSEMKDKIKSMLHNETKGNMPTEENHKLVERSILRFATLFNEMGIDYYIVGALPCFLKTGKPLFRYHDDIDIMVSEEDLPKVAEAVKALGYDMHDDRFPSKERYEEMKQKKPPHTVLAQNPDNEFHIGFFLFRREQDGSITMREYSHREEEGRVVTDVLERRSDPVGTSLRYDEEPCEYKGAKFRTCSTENVYHLKEYTSRPKDILDRIILEPYLDKRKLAAIKQCPLTNVEIKDVKPVSFTGEQR